MRLRAAAVLLAAPAVATAGDHRTYPLPPPDWHYHNLPGGPSLTTDYPFKGWPGYRGAYANLLPLVGGHRPTVPVYAPLPCVEPNPDPVHHPNRTLLGFGWGYYGWFGPYRALPRHLPYSVSVRPAPAGPSLVAAPAGDPVCLTVRVSVPAAAELFVDGVKTAQTGADRLFESPPADAGSEVRYELTARWVENGAPVERTRAVSGRPGETVRVDFTAAGGQ